MRLVKEAFQKREPFPTKGYSLPYEISLILSVQWRLSKKHGKSMEKQWHLGQDFMETKLEVENKGIQLIRRNRETGIRDKFHVTAPKNLT